MENSAKRGWINNHIIDIKAFARTMRGNPSPKKAIGQKIAGLINGARYEHVKLMIKSKFIDRRMRGT
jgi:hypothetical protein